jgi:hypothetical protein
MSAKVGADYVQHKLQPILPCPLPEQVNVALETPEVSPSDAFHPATNSEMLNSSASGIDIEPMRIKQDPRDRDDDYGDDGPPTYRLRSLLDQTTHQVRESKSLCKTKYMQCWTPYPASQSPEGPKIRVFSW